MIPRSRTNMRRWFLVVSLLLFSPENSFGDSDKERGPQRKQLRRRRRRVIEEDQRHFLEKNGRISNGNKASGSYPYFVLYGGCGATLIHNDIALTAAHCSSKDEAVVNPGSRYSSSNTHAHVSRVKRHPNYDSSTLEYDFAVIKLDGWFQSGTVKLNGSSNSPGVGDSLRILGFGGSSSLQQGKVQAISSALCAFYWRQAGHLIDEDSVVCAYSEEGISPCDGDSGGPLLSSSNEQLGVVSAGSNCNGRIPAIYSRVSAAKGWIQDQICNLSDFPPSNCKSSNKPTVRVDVHLDDYPEDIRWKIRSNGDVFAEGDGFEIPNSLESQFVNLPRGASYDFVIEDISGFADGLGSRGKYKVVEVNGKGNDGKVLVSGGGDFGRSETATFLIAPDPTKLPTSNPIWQASSRFPQPTENVLRATNGPVPLPATEPPTSKPTRKPTAVPTTTTTKQPSTPKPTQKPTRKPTAVPTATITKQPSSSKPTNKPTNEPMGGSSTPSLMPSLMPTNEPTKEALTQSPTKEPTDPPTKPPTLLPTNPPTHQPTKPLTNPPTNEPTNSPTDPPTFLPTNPLTHPPTNMPTHKPTELPTKPPTNEPTSAPTLPPTPEPTNKKPNSKPTNEPTDDSVPDMNRMLFDSISFGKSSYHPTVSPAPTQSILPSEAPSEDEVSELRDPAEPSSLSRTRNPASVRTKAPVYRTEDPASTATALRSEAPTKSSTDPQTHFPSKSPSVRPTPVDSPSVSPTTKNPTGNPIDALSNSPSENQLDVVSEILTVTPSASSSTKSPLVFSASPTEFRATGLPSGSPSDGSLQIPSVSPTPSPSISTIPSEDPSVSATNDATAIPTAFITYAASASPTGSPSPSIGSPVPSINSTSTESPSESSTDIPTNSASNSPSISPVDSLSQTPTSLVSNKPTESPSVLPTVVRSNETSESPSVFPIETASMGPSAVATNATYARPTSIPSSSPTGIESNRTSDSPSTIPIDVPSISPSDSPSISESPSESPTAPKDTSSAPSGIIEISENPSATVSNNSTSTPSATPSVSPTENPTNDPTERPTVTPSATPTEAPSSAPTVAPNRYMVYVITTINENPEEVSWRVVDASTKKQYYRYGLYDSEATFSNFFNMETGDWKFELNRETAIADVTVEIGVLNLMTGTSESFGELAFGSDSTDTTASISIALD